MEINLCKYQPLVVERPRSSSHSTPYHKASKVEFAGKDAHCAHAGNTGMLEEREHATMTRIPPREEHAASTSSSASKGSNTSKSRKGSRSGKENRAPSPGEARLPAGQTLLFDADDTLWENNIYFERAIAAFISLLDHRTHSREEVRETLNQVEHETIAALGYGLHSFRQSLITCFERLSDGPIDAHKHTRIHSFANAILEQEIELLPGVAETLPGLAERHRIVLVTKGQDGEQRDKLRRSGVEEYFTAVEVLADKTAAAYRELVERHQLPPSSTWMIGNSPKSDINPSLQAGLHAVFIQHRHTWVLEHEPLNEAPAGQRRLDLNRFADLSLLF